MTDVNPENVPEMTDEQALAEVDLVELGVTDEMTPEALLFIWNLGNEHLDIVLAAANAAKEAAKSGTATDPKSIARARVNAVPAIEILDSTMSDVLESIFEVLDKHPSQAAAALTSLGGIVKFVTDVRETEFLRVTALVKAEKGLDPNTPDADEDAEHSKNVFKACRGILTKLIGVCSVLKKPVPAEIPTKKNAAGDLVPEMRDLPKGRAAGTSSPNSGRGAKGRRVKYTWTSGGVSTELREGITLAEIAVTVISQGKVRVTIAELQDMFGKDGIDQFSETPWVIEFESGSLSGYLPKQ